MVAADELEADVVVEVAAAVNEAEAAIVPDDRNVPSNPLRQLAKLKAQWKRSTGLFLLCGTL